jgi:hypothetical protein
MRDVHELDAPVPVALRYRVMPWLLRRAATLIVAESIALQVLLLGFVLGAHVGSDPFAVICASDSADDHKGPLKQNNSDCSACPLACGRGSLAVVPSGTKLSLAPSASRLQSSVLWDEALPLPATHRPQASRAPPIEG